MKPTVRQIVWVVVWLLWVILMWILLKDKRVR